ncbi:hypothetical protein HY950_01700 [Candidatus Gottesmanbacteria bacterium]|nr:hypothetical protein [Candidatus Gottesmanbacteria bacterium]
MNICISSTFVGRDGYGLVTRILDAVAEGKLPGITVSAVISTRESGDDKTSDQLLARLHEAYPDVPIIAYSAKQHGRIKRKPSEKEKDLYDLAILERLGAADLNIMVGDMIIKGPEWCRKLPSLNLHPDLPLSLGGTEGMYWEVIGKWVRDGRGEIGGMMHLAIPTLDAGTPIAYFRLPARGTVNGVDLAPLWDTLPKEPDKREALIQQQVALKDKPTHRLFVELRRAEAAFEQRLVLSTITMFAQDELGIQEGRVVDKNGQPLENGLDITEWVVDGAAVWPGGESSGKSRSPETQ